MTSLSYITLRSVTKYYFVDKKRKITPNGWKQLLISRSVPFSGRNQMPLHVSSIHVADRFRDLTVNSEQFPRVKTFRFF